MSFLLLPSFPVVGEVGLDRRAGRAERVRIFTDVTDACRDRPFSSRCTRTVAPQRLSPSSSAHNDASADPAWKLSSHPIPQCLTSRSAE